MPVTGADQLVYITTRIETQGPDGAGSGTGFFVEFPFGSDKKLSLLVTNKHVITGAKTGWITINLAGADGEPQPKAFERVMFNDFEKVWTLHSDPDVDLAAMPLGPLLKQLHDAGKRTFVRTLAADMIARQTDLDALTAMESIVMVGYPNGIWDSKNNRPIIRRGITATPPYDNFDDGPQFVIDCACFPGSSGSPVLIYDHMHVDKHGNTNVANRVLLLGVLFAGPQFTAEGEIEIVQIPTATQRPIAKTPVMINLGYCVRAEQLFWFESHFKKKLTAAKHK
jgi:V8-like Glu-specific endopeptidase